MPEIPQPSIRFAANMRRLRTAAGLSQEELSFRAAIHRTQISLLEGGHRMPRVFTLGRTWLLRGLAAAAVCLAVIVVVRAGLILYQEQMLRRQIADLLAAPQVAVPFTASPRKKGEWLAVPVPAPLPLVEALLSVDVNSGRNGSGFQLKFSVGKRSLIQTILLPSGALDPMVTRVVIIVTLLGIPQVIMDGVVTQHQLSPGNDPGQSTLTLTGEDLSILMGVVQMKIPYPALTDAGKIAVILAKYAMFGVVPRVIPPLVDTPKSPTDGFEIQTTTDLNYIQELAGECGYTFYIQPGPLPMQSIAYFGPDISNPLPQPATMRFR